MEKAKSKDSKQSTCIQTKCSIHPEKPYRSQELGSRCAHDYKPVWTKGLHMDEYTTVKSLALDVCTTTNRYGPSYLDIWTGWHYHCTPFAITARRKRGMDSTEEIPHGEGPDHAVELKQEHAQMLQLAERG
jgi:hypothetical protein